MKKILKWRVLNQVIAVVLWIGVSIGCAGEENPVADVPTVGSDTTPQHQPDVPGDTTVALDTAVAGGCEGGCTAGSRCIDDKCVPSYCPPNGPYGIHPGETLTDVVVKDCDGNDVHIHELCGAPAGYFNLLAGW